MSDTNERSVASAGSVASAFGDWFDAQFPPVPSAMASRSEDELQAIISAGRAAEAERLSRRVRAEMERAALMAWQAAERLNPACQVTL
jgi:hypothetical protein